MHGCLMSRGLEVAGHLARDYEESRIDHAES
jgi:hypothetical protein